MSKFQYILWLKETTWYGQFVDVEAETSEDAERIVNSSIPPPSSDTWEYHDGEFDPAGIQLVAIDGKNPFYKHTGSEDNA